MISLTTLDSDPSGFAYLPQWFDDESLYSWASRFHRLQGRVSEKQTGMTLFGQVHAARLREIPTGIARFVAFTKGQLGGTAEIVQRRTVLCELLPFLTAPSLNLLVGRFEDSRNASDTRSAIGLTAGGMGRTQPLRYCAECVKIERAELGSSYWHVRQQLHGSIACLQHQRPLDIAVVKGTIWVLPHHRISKANTPGTTDDLLQTALLLSRLVIACCDLRNVNSTSLAESAIRSLLEKGVATSIPRLSSHVLEKWFSTTRTKNAAYAYYPLNTALQSGDWIVRLLRARRTGHPFHWILLWSAILEDQPPDTALQYFCSAATGTPRMADQYELWPELCDGNRFTIPPRQAQVILQSRSIREAALRIGTTQGTIKRWLLLDEEVNRQWRATQRLERQTLAVDRVEDALHTSGQITRTVLLKKCKTDMSWLAANARPVFHEFLNRIPNERPGGESLNFQF
jgi:hypothetical protein